MNEEGVNVFCKNLLLENRVEILFALIFLVSSLAATRTVGRAALVPRYGGAAPPVGAALGVMAGGVCVNPSNFVSGAPLNEIYQLPQQS